MTRSHQHTPEEERREAALDQTIEGSFPASDPPSSIPNPDDHDAVEPEVQPDEPNDRKPVRQTRTLRIESNSEATFFRLCELLAREGCVNSICVK
jgi:hypothetical protein